MRHVGDEHVALPHSVEVARERPLEFGYDRNPARCSVVDFEVLWGNVNFGAHRPTLHDGADGEGEDFRDSETSQPLSCD